MKSTRVFSQGSLAWHHSPPGTSGATCALRSLCSSCVPFRQMSAGEGDIKATSKHLHPGTLPELWAATASLQCQPPQQLLAKAAPEAPSLGLPSSTWGLQKSCHKKEFTTPA